MSGTTPTGQFKITNGQITDPNGNAFTAEGLNVYDAQMGDAAQILANFPGVNFIRLNVYSYQNPNAYASFIQTMTSKGVVVELEDHTNSNGSDAGGGSGTVFTGSQLTNELNWYSAVAGAYANNPYVWFGSNNEPPNNRSAGSSAAVTDASGNAWTITAGGQVAINGTADATTGNVTELAYVNGTIWQENSANMWWGETQPNAAWSPQAGTATSPLPAPPAPKPIVTPSANDTVVNAGSNAAIVDSAGNKWTITSGAQVAVNGNADATTAGVIELAYVNGTIWQENSASLWSGETQPNASWAPAAGTAVSPLPSTPTPTPTGTTSANDTVVQAGSTTAIVDASANQWTITSGGQIAVNGVTDTTTANVTELAYVNGQVWQENTSKLWWGKTSPTAAWSPNAGSSTSPLPTSVAIAATQTSATIALSQVTITATAGNHMVFISGTGDTAQLSGGTETITDTGGSNTYVIPAAGKGDDAFVSNVLTANDTLDLRTALAAPKWAGSTSTLSRFLSVKDTAQGAVLSVAAQSGGACVGIASISGATTATLTSVLAHAIA